MPSIQKNKFYSLIFFIFSALNIFEANLRAENLFILNAPVNIGDQFIFSFGRLTSGNDFLDRSSKEWYFSVDCGLSNTLTRKEQTRVDYESQNCGFFAEVPLPLGKLSAKRGFLNTGGGIFDPAIDAYHRALGFPNGGRNRVPDNEYNVSYTDSSGSRNSIESVDFALSDLQLAYTLPLKELKDGKRNFYLDISSTVPSHGGRFSLNEPDIKLSLVFEDKNYSFFNYQFGASGIYHWDNFKHGVEYERFTYGAWASFQYLLTDSLVLLIQGIINSRLHQDLGDLSKYTLYLDTGLRKQVFQNQAIDFIVRENPGPSAGTVDISMFLRYTFLL